MSQEPTQKPLPGIDADDLPAGDPRHLLAVARRPRPITDRDQESAEDKSDRELHNTLRQECMRRWIRPEIRRRGFKTFTAGVQAVHLEAEGQVFKRAYQILFPAGGGKVTVRLGPEVDLTLEPDSYALRAFDGGHVTILERDNGTAVQVFDFSKNDPARRKSAELPQAVKGAGK